MSQEKRKDKRAFVVEVISKATNHGAYIEKGVLLQEILIFTVKRIQTSVPKSAWFPHTVESIQNPVHIHNQVTQAR